MQEKPKPLTIRPSWPTRLVALGFALAVGFMVSDRLLPLGGDLFSMAVVFIFALPAVLLLGTKVTCANDVLMQRILWHKTSVRISRLKRVEYYTQPVLGVNHILRLEDDQKVLRIIISNFSAGNVARLADAIQESLVSSGIRTNFIVLGSLRGK
jgi:hypothetical protein